MVEREVKKVEQQPDYQAKQDEVLNALNILNIGAYEVN